MFINTNLSALQSSRFLADSNSLLTKALSRLSSGSRITSPEDDAGGLAQSVKLNSQTRRLDALVQNTGNLISFLQTQEGFLQKVSKALDRMSELSVLAKDATKSSADVSLYTQEFNGLGDFINNVMNKKFNGVNLFSDNTLTVLTDSGGSSKTFSDTNLAAAIGKGNEEYTIDLTFTGGLSDDQKNLFYSAANRWQSIITADVPDSGGVDDLSITVNAAAIDGVGGVLGNAAPTTVRGGSPAVTITGAMNFDTADLDSLESDGRLYGVILHEMGHVLGIGSLWSTQGLTTTGDGPEYTGAEAVARYNEIFGTSFSTLPTEDGGGAGTAEVHPEEGDAARTIGGIPALGLDNEIMTGFAESAGVASPLSTISIGFLKDLGYTADYLEADPYSGPGTGTGPRQGVGINNVEYVKNSIRDVAALRASVGANISDAMNLNDMLQIEKENLSSAVSRITDTDVAKETIQFSKAQILVNSGTAMLAQANVLPRTVLQLLGA